MRKHRDSVEKFNADYPHSVSVLSRRRCYTLQRLHKRRSYIFSEQFPTFLSFFFPIPRRVYPTRLHPGRRTADFLDYDPIQVPFRAKRPPVNLNNARRSAEASDRKTRADRRRSLVAPLPGSHPFLPVDRFTRDSRRLHGPNTATSLPLRRDDSTTGACLQEPLEVAYIIHTISGRVRQLGPELTTRLHARH